MILQEWCHHEGSFVRNLYPHGMIHHPNCRGTLTVKVLAFLPNVLTHSIWQADTTFLSSQNLSLHKAIQSLPCGPEFLSHACGSWGQGKGKWDETWLNPKSRRYFSFIKKNIARGSGKGQRTMEMHQARCSIPSLCPIESPTKTDEWEQIVLFGIKHQYDWKSMKILKINYQCKHISILNESTIIKIVL